MLPFHSHESLLTQVPMLHCGHRPCNLATCSKALTPAGASIRPEIRKIRPVPRRITRKAYEGKPTETSVTGEMQRPASYQPHVLLAKSDESTLRVEELLLQTCGYTGESCVQSAGGHSFSRSACPAACIVHNTLLAVALRKCVTPAQ